MRLTVYRLWMELPNDRPVNLAYYEPNSANEAIRGQPHDGITTVEQYITFDAHLGAGLYVSESAKISTQISIAHDTEHYSNAEDIG